MLRMHVSASGGSAIDYFTEGLSRDDYYTKSGDEQTRGNWFGEGASFLGLSGEVQRSEFVNLCSNLHPLTGEKLTSRTTSNRRVGADFVFDCPKSVSLLGILGGHRDVLDAFKEAVRETMSLIEADANTRVRKGGAQEDRLTGNLTWAEFIHLTARPERGVAEPHLHAHCYVINATLDSVEGLWKAVQLGPLKEDMPYYEAEFQARLAEKLIRLGFEIEAKGRYFDIVNTPPSLTAKFSSRSQVIKHYNESRGIEDPAEMAIAAKRTRKHKTASLSGPELREAWHARLTPDELLWLQSGARTRASEASETETARKAHLEGERSDLEQELDEDRVRGADEHAPPAQGEPAETAAVPGVDASAEESRRTPDTGEERQRAETPDAESEIDPDSLVQPEPGERMGEPVSDETTLTGDAPAHEPGADRDATPLAEPSPEQLTVPSGEAEGAEPSHRGGVVQAADSPDSPLPDSPAVAALEDASEPGEPSRLSNDDPLEGGAEIESMPVREFSPDAAAEEADAVDQGAKEKSRAAGGPAPEGDESIKAKPKTKKPGGDPGPIDRITMQAAEFAVKHVFERSAVVRPRHLIQEALRFAPGRVDRSSLPAAFEHHGARSKDIDGVSYYTTREALQEERSLVKAAAAGHGRFPPLREPLTESGDLTSEQLNALNHILTSPDLVTILDGGSGTGKTTMFKAAKEALGLKLVIVAPSQAVAHGDLPQEGIKSAKTSRKMTTRLEFPLAKLALTKVQQNMARNGMVWVEDAGRLTIADTLSLIERCDSLNARLVLAGDSRGRTPVARGDVLGVLREHANVMSAWLSASRRQEGALLEAVQNLQNGSIRAGLTNLEVIGAIREHKTGTEVRAAAQDYVASSTAVKSKTFVFANTRDERDALTAEIRTLLEKEGRLKNARPFEQLVPIDGTVAERGRSEFYKAGQVVRFHKHALGFKVGSEWDVVGKDPLGHVVVRNGWTVTTLPLGKCDRFQAYEKRRMWIGVGEKIRVTRRTLADFVGQKAVNESLKVYLRKVCKLNPHITYTVKRFTVEGDIMLSNGRVIPKDFRHLEHGYCLSTHGAHGEADTVIVCQTATQGYALSGTLFAGTVARAKKQVAVHTDNKGWLWNRLTAPEEERMSALDLEDRAWASLSRRRKHEDVPSRSISNERKRGRSR